MAGTSAYAVPGNDAIVSYGFPLTGSPDAFVRSDFADGSDPKAFSNSGMSTVAKGNLLAGDFDTASAGQELVSVLGDGWVRFADRDGTAPTGTPWFNASFGALNKWTGVGNFNTSQAGDEIVNVRNDGFVSFFDADGTQIGAYSATGISGSSSYAVGDFMTNKPGVELAAMNDDGFVRFLASDGTTSNFFVTAAINSSNVLFASGEFDLSNPGDELVHINTFDNTARFVQSDGTLIDFWADAGVAAGNFLGVGDFDNTGLDSVLTVGPDSFARFRRVDSSNRIISDVNSVVFNASLGEVVIGDFDPTNPGDEFASAWGDSFLRLYGTGGSLGSLYK